MSSSDPHSSELSDSSTSSLSEEQSDISSIVSEDDSQSTEDDLSDIKTLSITPRPETLALSTSLSETASPLSSSHSKLKSTWRLSPHTLRTKSCSCTFIRPERLPTTSAEYVTLMRDRFDKFWSRLVHLSTTTELLLAVERVILQLRRFGIELEHLVGRELGVDMTNRKRREISVLFLVPEGSSAEDGIGHRWVAEILVHLRIGKGAEIENIASRYWFDWEDWTVPQAFDYVADSSRELKQVKVEAKKEGVPWIEIVAKLGQVVEKVGSCRLIQDWTKTITRVTKELKKDGEKVFQWEVEKVWRKHRENVFPVVRIAFNVRKNKQRLATPGAVMLLEISRDLVASKEGIIRNVSVLYEGEWPVCHHYRTSIPSPSFEGLQDIVKGQRKSQQKEMKSPE
ncbi:uncharacterized protein L203_103197 [Cryptococcus depauperatus CBS 7841]|uniref:Uncharacterized protein n=1 Tax=Cryptococcus depauperatus CBS 7841 TaxID=1295531 RepID=A0A1E3IP91_9TREE|nr:hypothetical protein L203_01526 [Cryptococcus depauperatus CBS 7841]